MLQQGDSRAVPHGGRLLSPGLIPALELDLRLIGMLAALGLVWAVLSILSGGLFLTPRNLWTLSVQASAIAVLACGMVKTSAFARYLILTANKHAFTVSVLGQRNRDHPLCLERLPDSGAELPPRPAPPGGSAQRR